MTDSTPTPSENPTQPAPAAGTAPAAPVSPTPAPKAELTPEPTPQPKPAATATPETPAPKPEAKPPEATPPADALPEKYEIKPPEGVKLDDGVIAALTPVFKEAKLSAANAQKLATTFIKYQAEAVQRGLAADLDRTMKDPDVGQMNWGKTVGEVNRALAAFTTPEDREWMEKVAGVGNRLEFVRLFARIGRAMAEDRPARGSPTSADKPTTAKKLYGGGDLVGNDKA